MSSKPQNDDQLSPIIEWTSFPLVEYPLTSALLVAFLGGLAVLLWRITVVEWQMPLFYFLGVIFVVGSLITWFIPTRYRIFSERVEAWYTAVPMRRQLNDFRCYYVDKRGVMLGTFPHQTRLDRFRGMSLRFTRKQTEREEVLAFLDKRIGKRV